jgi:hypothetical protein
MIQQCWPPLRTTVSQCILLPVIALALSGCGNRFGAQVSGRVTISGKPATHGMIVFHPVESGPLAASTISTSGRYQLTTAGERSLEPGDYLVTITIVEPNASNSARDVQPPKTFVDLRYGSKDTSGLQCHIEPGSNTLDWDLTP